VPQGNDTITIEFKEFGVGLRFVPTVLNDGQINLKLNISRQRILSGNSVALSATNAAATFVVPSLSKRSRERDGRARRRRDDRDRGPHQREPAFRRDEVSGPRLTCR
jgi:Flp pilus assembly secretin CpaC